MTQITKPKKSRNKIRVAVMSNHFIQYNSPIFRGLERENDLEVFVYYLTDRGLRPAIDPEFGVKFNWDVDLDKGYKWKVLSSDVNKNSNLRILKSDIRIALLSFNLKADVVLFMISYGRWSTVLFLYVLLLRRIPVLYRGDTTLNTEKSRIRWLKRLILAPLFRINIWGCYVGELAKKYILSLGTPTSRLIFTPHCVDEGFWGKQAQILADRRHELRRKFGLPPNIPVILYSGKLNENKRVLDLAKAFCLLAKKRPVSMLVVGSGNLQTLMQQVTSGCPDATSSYLGFINQTSMPGVYVAADVICLPSESETWGLVINEAMQFGCVPVVSDRVGCGPDLVSGVGEIFHVGNVQEIAQALEKVLEDLPARRERIPERLERYSLKACTEGIINVIRLVTEKSN